jgi:hypothetical protein
VTTIRVQESKDGKGLAPFNTAPALKALHLTGLEALGVGHVRFSIVLMIRFEIFFLWGAADCLPRHYILQEMGMGSM